MEENENLVEQTENVEQTTEETVTETPKMFTQDEVNEIVGKRVARNEARIRKEYDRKYGNLTEVLKAGTGKESVEEVTDTLTKFYQSKGIKIPERPTYSETDNRRLAKAEADEIISAGFEEVVDEVDRLMSIGADNMTPREKMVFKALAEHRQSVERSRELAQIGVTEEVYNSNEFQSFMGQFNPNTPIGDIYKMYVQMQPKKEIKTMGSMKQGQNTGVKDYYSPEEIERLTDDDLDDPRVWEAVRRSMTGR